MSATPLTRRDFVKNSALAAAALQIPSVMSAASASLAAAPGSAGAGVNPVDLHWLEGGVPAEQPGATWGMPWPRGKLAKDTAFAVRTAAGEPVPVQTWPLATWPDGTLKWSAHALPAGAGKTDRLTIAPGTATTPVRGVTVTESPDAFTIDTGVIVCRVARRGAQVIQSITRDGREIAREGRLVCQRQVRTDFTPDAALSHESFTGAISTAVVEQSGPVRAVVRLEGKHEGPNGRAWLPFTVRLYFHAGADSVRMAHSFIFDGEQSQDFIRGLGVRFAVPLRDELHNRHVRFTGEGQGMWGESPHNLPGWAGRFGFAYADLFPEQLDGQKVLSIAEMDAKSREQFETVAVWNDFTLFQSSADHFDVRKRTKPNSSWVKSGHGHRSTGLAYLGGVSGGLAVGRKHFWEMHPTQIDINDAASDTATLTMWLWSPDAPPMDLRHYSDHAQGLEINYEDWEEGHSTPLGVSRTNELMLWAFAATPRRTRLLELVGALRAQPQLVCPPEHYHAAGVFGRWSLPNRSTPDRARLEDELLKVVGFYQKEVEQQQWYGFWHYGDIMHTFDAHRHVWRYDVGGYAWANSEMVPDMWLWYSFLRTGRADIFRMAESMTRHTSEVDMYKLGPFAPLGSRHNVSHWGCGAKEARISMAGLKRFYYYLTADERVGDLMRMTVNADFKTVDVDPLRKLGLPLNGHPTHARSGPDFYAFCSNWMTEWERTGDTKWRDKIITGMDSLTAMPHGLYSGPNFAYDPATTSFFDVNDIEKANWLMMGVFGGSEVMFEVMQLVDHPAWDKAWLQMCEFWNDDAGREKLLGRKFATGTYPIWYSRFTAYAAWKRGDAVLAKRAWNEFLHGINRIDIRRMPIAPERIEGPAVLNPVDVLSWLETNHSSQWSLNLIENLEFIGEHLPPLDGPWLQS